MLNDDLLIRIRRLASAPDRHDESVGDELSCHFGLHRPADDMPVPWRPVIDRQLGRKVTGVVQVDRYRSL